MHLSIYTCNLQPPALPYTASMLSLHSSILNYGNFNGTNTLEKIPTIEKHRVQLLYVYLNMLPMNRNRYQCLPASNTKNPSTNLGSSLLIKKWLPNAIKINQKSIIILLLCGNRRWSPRNRWYGASGRSLGAGRCHHIITSPESARTLACC